MQSTDTINSVIFLYLLNLAQKSTNEDKVDVPIMHINQFYRLITEKKNLPS